MFGLTPLEILLILTTLLELNPLFQSSKIVKTKEVKDVAITTYFMILTIGTLWLIYGYSIMSWPLIIGNFVKLVASLSVVIIYFLYKTKQK